MTLPNILTLTRLTAAPMLGIMFLYFTRPFADWAALILFVGAALTDWVDGYVARTWKQESKLGTMLDPIADKAMVLIALLVITGIFGLNPLVLLPATLIVFREVFVSGLREFLGEVAGTLKVTKLAKWKTAFEFLAIILLASFFANHNFEGPLKGSTSLNGVAGILSLWFSSVLSLWTAAIYFKHGLKN